MSSDDDDQKIFPPLTFEGGGVSRHRIAPYTPTGPDLCASFGAFEFSKIKGEGGMSEEKVSEFGTQPPEVFDPPFSPPLPPETSVLSSI